MSLRSLQELGAFRHGPVGALHRGGLRVGAGDVPRPVPRRRGGAATRDGRVGVCSSPGVRGGKLFGDWWVCFGGATISFNTRKKI